MRKLLLIAAVGSGLIAGEAHAADIPGDASTKVRLQLTKVFERDLGSKNDNDWLRLKLEKGRSYVIGASWGCRQAAIRVLDPKRRPITGTIPWEWETGGAMEVKAKVNGDHFVAVSPGSWDDFECGLIAQASEGSSEPAVINVNLVKGRYFVDASVGYADLGVDFYVTARPAASQVVAR